MGATVRLVLLYAAGAAMAALATWLVIAGWADEAGYRALARSGLLLLGLLGIAWGLLWHRLALVAAGLGLLGIGLLTFAGPFGNVFSERFAADLGGSGFWWRVRWGLHRDLSRGLSLMHVATLACLVGNAVMLHRGFGLRRMVTGNIVLVACTVTMAFLLAAR